ncbi:RidA family protein [Brucella gallinifaecis]|nr:RidA family protein [Brucella gallinifaecis]
MSSVINGVDSSTGVIPATLEEQCECMFSNVRHIVETAGGSVNDIVKFTIWLRNPDDRIALNSQWEAMFPDPLNRPARHAHQGHMRAELLIQCDIVAILDKD